LGDALSAAVIALVQQLQEDATQRAHATRAHASQSACLGASLSAHLDKRTLETSTILAV